MMEKKWLNKNELKEYVGFSIGKIDSMMKSNELSYSKIGKNVRFDKNEVDNLLNSKVL
jgi:excisionase family DNA binding protein|tara:strand:+ start:3051 stop:3224 length:174 start_codon:yes stop_codon:yes gene_type:complete